MSTLDQQEADIIVIDPERDIHRQVSAVVANAQNQTYILLDDSRLRETVKQNGNVVRGEESQLLSVSHQIERALDATVNICPQGRNAFHVIPPTIDAVYGHNKFTTVSEDVVSRRHLPGVVGIDYEAQQAYLNCQAGNAHLVQTIAIAEDPRDGRQVSLQKRVPGERLTDCRHDLTFNQMLTVTEQISGAAAYLHNQDEPLIQRDLKPGNIVVETRDGDGVHAILMDPDLMTRKHATVPGDVQGTPPFPPEMYPTATFPRAQAFICPETDSYKLADTLAMFLNTEKWSGVRERGDARRRHRGAFSVVQRVIKRWKDSAEQYLPERRCRAEHIQKGSMFLRENMTAEQQTEAELFYQLTSAESQGDTNAALKALEDIHALQLDDAENVLEDLALKKIEKAQSLIPEPFGEADRPGCPTEGMVYLSQSITHMEEALQRKSMHYYDLERIASRLANTQSLLAQCEDQFGSIGNPGYERDNEENAWRSIAGLAALKTNNPEAMKSLRLNTGTDPHSKEPVATYVQYLEEGIATGNFPSVSETVSQLWGTYSAEDRLRYSLLLRTELKLLLSPTEGQRNPLESEEHLRHAIVLLELLRAFDGTLCADYDVLYGHVLSSLQDIQENADYSKRIDACSRRAMESEPKNERGWIQWAQHELQEAEPPEWTEEHRKQVESFSQTQAGVILKMERFAEDNPLNASPDFFLALAKMYPSTRQADALYALEEAYLRDPSHEEVNRELVLILFAQSPVPLGKALEHIKICFCCNEYDTSKLLSDCMYYVLNAGGAIDATEGDLRELHTSWSAWLPLEILPHETVLQIAIHCQQTDFAHELTQELWGDALPLAEQFTVQDSTLLGHDSLEKAWKAFDAYIHGRLPHMTRYTAQEVRMVRDTPTLLNASDGEASAAQESAHVKWHNVKPAIREDSTDPRTFCVSIPLRVDGDKRWYLEVFLECDTFPEREILEVFRIARNLEMLDNRDTALEAQMKIREEQTDREIAGNLQALYSNTGSFEFGDHRGLAVIEQGSEKVGGDGINIVRLDENRTLVSVTDVCGHGIAAAMRSVEAQLKLQSVLQTIPIDTEKTVEGMTSKELMKHIYSRVDQLIDNRTERWVCPTVLIIDHKNNIITYALSGQYIVHIEAASGKVTSHAGFVAPWGVLRDLTVPENIEPREMSINPHDKILTGTDGIIETQDSDTSSDRYWNLEGLIAAVESCKDNSIEDIVAEVMRRTAKSQDNRAVFGFEAST